MSRETTEVARRHAEDALEDALDFIRALRHRNDRVWRLRRAARKTTRRTRRRIADVSGAASAGLQTTGRVAGHLPRGGRGAAFGTGIAAGLVAGFLIGRAVRDVAVRDRVAQLAEPVTRTSRTIVDKAGTAADVGVHKLQSTGKAVGSATSKAATTVAHSPAAAWSGVAGRFGGNGGARTVESGGEAATED